MPSFALTGAAFGPGDIEIIATVFDRVTAEPWFSGGIAYREQFARYVLAMYVRGLVLPDRLEGLCRAAAEKHFRMARSDFEGFRFLIVEDDYLLAADAKRTLTSLGAEVIGPVPTVAHALETVEHGLRLDGAILDINLDGQMVYPIAAL